MPNTEGLLAHGGQEQSVEQLTRHCKYSHWLKLSVALGFNLFETRAFAVVLSTDLKYQLLRADRFEHTSHAYLFFSPSWLHGPLGCFGTTHFISIIHSSQCR